MINMVSGEGQVYHLCPDQYQHGKGLNRSSNGKEKIEAGGTTDRKHLNDIWNEFHDKHLGQAYCLTCGPQNPETALYANVPGGTKRFKFEVHTGFTSITYNPENGELKLYG